MTQKKEKIFTVRTSRSRMNGKTSESTYTGTLAELHQTFGYTLEIGHSWNSKIPLVSKTIKSFVNNLQKSYEEKEANCYDRTYVELIETVA